jgi:hypothetical protein
MQRLRDRVLQQLCRHHRRRAQQQQQQQHLLPVAETTHKLLSYPHRCPGPYAMRGMACRARAAPPASRMPSSSLLRAACNGLFTAAGLRQWTLPKCRMSTASAAASSASTSAADDGDTTPPPPAPTTTKPVRLPEGLRESWMAFLGELWERGLFADDCCPDK